MITVRPADARGVIDMGWLSARHSFSFGEYYDPAHQGVSALRVINDDHVAPGAGFPAHGHRDMEIISIVLSGAMAHEDSMGNGSTMRPGDVQVMSAGTGVTHSEFNASDSEPLHSLQIWLFPDRRGVTPRYDQTHLVSEKLANRLQPVVSASGAEGALTMHQDATLYRCNLKVAARVVHRVDAARSFWLQVISGRVRAEGQTLGAGDGAQLDGLTALIVDGVDDSDFLLFDLRDAAAVP